jgi:hypothetical protein
MEQSLKKIPDQVYVGLKAVMKKYSVFSVDEKLMKKVETECQVILDNSKLISKSYAVCNNITNITETILKKELHVVIVYSDGNKWLSEHLTSMPSDITKKQLSEFIKGQNV